MKILAKKVANILFLSSLFLVIFLVTPLVFSSILFFFNFRISSLSAICSIIFSFIIYYFVCYKRKDFTKREIILGNLVAILMIFIAIGLATQIYDFAWDSNWYHKSALGALKLGWNPLYQDFEEFIKTTDMYGEALKYSKIWAQHYCKASWITGANIYSLTNNIETAKSVNLIMVFVLFGFSYHYFLITRFKNWQAIMLAILLVFNPITCSQVFTLYVDNLLMTNFFAIMIALFGLTDTKYKISEWYKYFMLAMLVIFCINIKFTGLAYSGIFCFLFFCIWCVKAFFDGKFKDVFVKNIVFYIITCSIAIFVVGASTYLTNFINKGHPLYPLAGEGKIDIMSSNEPHIFADLSTLEKLFISIFAETSNIYGDEIPKLKPLFSVSDFEMEIAAAGVDTRIGGFGPVFGGILVLAIGVIGMALVILYKKDKYWFAIFSSLLIVIFLMLSLITESWWARYSPYLYMVVLFAVVFLFVGYNRVSIFDREPVFIASIFFVVFLLINTGFFAQFIVNSKERTDIAKEELIEIQEHSQDNKIKVNFIHGTLAGIEFNLKDYDINYEFVDRTELPGKDFYGGLAKIENWE